MNKKKFEKPDLSVEELSAELVIANLELSKAHKRLLEEENARTQMFSNISHDLRSPITAIKNAVEMLNTMNSYPVEKVSPLLKIINNRVSVLEQLINDIFLLVSLDNHYLNMNIEQLPIGFFLEDFFFSRQADECYASRKLLLEVPENLSVCVAADSHQLTRVLDNLFSNALKYSKDNDSICLKAKQEETQIVISVTDTGIGIAPEHIDKIFDRCYIVEQARTPGTSSTGLGLSICQAIVETFSGKIWCESIPGKGSTFSFSLPLVS